MGQRTTQTQPHLEGSRAPWSLIACARRENVSIQTSECEPTSLQTSHNPPNTHSLSRSRGTIQQWRPCRPCRNRRSWRRAECRPHTCLGWWQPARPDPGTGRYWCPAWRTSSLWSPYSWPPGSCPALPTQRQTNKHRLFSGGQLHKRKKSRQHAQKHLLFPMQINCIYHPPNAFQCCQFQR